MIIDGLLPYLPQGLIRAAFERSPGNEISSGKLASPESSAALAANTFGFFLDQPEVLPPIPGTEHCAWPATCVTIEESAPFPWAPRGQQPWLDAFAETPTHIVGIESKRYEPFRSKAAGTFSPAYWRDVWGSGMGPFEMMRDELNNGQQSFKRLDAVQLVKHAFGLRTEAQRRSKPAHLVYLYAEPHKWPDGRPVLPEKVKEHRLEVPRFARQVRGAEVTFSTLTYSELLAAFQAKGGGVAEHAVRVQEIIEYPDWVAAPRDSR